MQVKFLKTVEAPQVFTRTRCECCGPERQPAEPTTFVEGQVEDPNEHNAEINLSGLTYRVDYDIIEYP